MMVHRCPLCTKRSTAPCAVSCNRHASQRPCRAVGWGGGKGEYLQNQFPELGIRNLELWAHRGCTQRGAFWLITMASYWWVVQSKRWRPRHRRITYHRRACWRLP